MKDKFSEAIDKILSLKGEERNKLLYHAWINNNAGEYPESCLFNFIGPDYTYGCLTQIRLSGTGNYNRMRAFTPELTEEIAADERLPTAISDLYKMNKKELRKTLNLFAKYQRRKDVQAAQRGEVLE